MATEKNMKHKKRTSFLWGIADKITALIYSFFIHGRIGDMLSSDDTLCKKSYFARTYERKKKNIGNSVLSLPEMLLEQSTVSKILVFLRGFLASLRLNVYGMFFTFYGLASCIAYVIPAFSGGLTSVDEYALISAGIVMLCGIPLLFSSQSAVEAISNSRFMSSFVLDILCIPKERLKVKRQYGGTIYMFIAAVVAMILGGLSAYTHPLFTPAVMLCVVLSLVVFAFPEAGVVLTLAIIPFLQYFPNPNFVLLLMIVITGLSYLCKIILRRRTFSLSPEITMVMIFCGFVIISGSFSAGGMKTFSDSCETIVYIIGGFLITYNLVKTEKTLSACTKAITVSFLVLCLIGIWESVYNGLSARIIDSVNPTMAPIADEKILYILDDGFVFGMFAVFVFPMLFAYMSKRKSAQGVALVMVLCVIVVSAAWMCSHYEIIVALLIECIVFWLMNSHKTMTAVIFALLPIGIVAMLYPYAVAYFGWQNISDIVMEFMPANMPSSELHPTVIADVCKMISDGNWTGIGVGEHAFMSVFPAYSNVISSSATQPLSLWLQIICWSGIFGLAAFSVFVLFTLKRSLGYFIASEKNDIRSKALALFCGIITTLLLGCTYGIWIDERVLYVFWSSVGLLMGYIRLGNNDNEMRRASFANSEDANEVEVIFYD